MRLGHKKTQIAHVLSSYQRPHVGELNPRNRKEQLSSHSSRQYRRPDALLRVNWSKYKVDWPLEKKYTRIGYSRWGESWVRIVCWDVFHVRICLYIYTRGVCKNSNRPVARKLIHSNVHLIQNATKCSLDSCKKRPELYLPTHEKGESYSDGRGNTIASTGQR